MSAASKPNLPPNPYKRSPIKKREELAGRSRELKSIHYYLGLTAAGQSPHLALIGQRGVGKTSLLNGAETTARDLKLLPVRLDMNEQKANSQWIFWHDLYQTLALTMAKAGCWGGLQGKIYAELLRMIHSRQPGSLDNAVMQIPFVFSCHQGDANNFECPDALVVHDFEACMVELQSRGLTGIALLIDEADCLGKNVPLLQMFRNIFQVVEHCSLVLAGTEGVFPALSEVFSPIPRQFHRIDIKPFGRWSDTLDLVLRPLSSMPKDQVVAITPERFVIQDLHHLCGGAPDEVQLYCHHMYRSLEDGSAKQMTLAPQVFREVLREYRSNSTVNADAVLNAIERLPDKLLFESNWVSRRALTLEENVRVSILCRELKAGKQLSEVERVVVACEMRDGYRRLFDLGITEIDNCIRLAGAPLTAGFWKSFVEVERSKRWTWDDDSFADLLRQPIMKSIGMSCAAFAQFETAVGNEIESAVGALRAGETLPEINDSFGELIFTCLLAKEEQIMHVADCLFSMESPAGKQSFQCRYFEKIGFQLESGRIENWIANSGDLLAGNEIRLELRGFRKWQIPSPEELHRLGRITGSRIPDVFGPTEMAQSVEMFGEGDIQGCMDMFSRMLADKDEPDVRNNLAFCQILTGAVGDGLDNATKAMAGDYEPLYEMNKGIAEFLLGDPGAANHSLSNALQQLVDPHTEFEPTPSYVLVLDSALDKVISLRGIPVDAAILINQWRMGTISRTELEAALTKIDSEKANTWLVQVP